jgi:hypothetical protein
VGFSSEEAGLRGSKRFVAAHAPALLGPGPKDKDKDKAHALSTQVINLDGIYDERFLTVVNRHKTPHPNPVIHTGTPAQAMDTDLVPVYPRLMQADPPVWYGAGGAAGVGGARCVDVVRQRAGGAGHGGGAGQGLARPQARHPPRRHRRRLLPGYACAYARACQLDLWWGVWTSLLSSRRFDSNGVSGPNHGLCLDMQRRGCRA